MGLKILFLIAAIGCAIMAGVSALGSGLTEGTAFMPMSLAVGYLFGVFIAVPYQRPYTIAKMNDEVTDPGLWPVIGMAIGMFVMPNILNLLDPALAHDIVANVYAAIASTFFAMFLDTPSRPIRDKYRSERTEEDQRRKERGRKAKRRW